MKVMFINPNLGGVSGLNVGLAYVVSSVEKRHGVKLLDLSFCLKNYRQYILGEIRAYQPDIIAFSTTSFTHQKSLEIGKFIRQVYSDLPFVFGGVHPTLLPEQTIQHSLVDVICIGEGEDSFLEYLDKLNEDQAPNVEGIWYKEGSGRICRNKLRPFKENIDDLPFPNWEHWEIERYLKTNLYYLPGALKYLSSRGCPYDCSFCSNQAIKEMVPGRYYRVRGAENIIEEIKLNLARFGQRGFSSIAFGDEVFGLDLQWLKRFCQLYKKEGLSDKVKWTCATRADVITEEWASIVADSGCKMVMLGIESGDDHIRMQVYKKNISRKDIIKATSNLNNHGLAFGFYMLVGCPQDNWKTIKAGINLVRELNPLVSHFSFYQPLPKTELAGQIKDVRWDSEKALGGYWNMPRVRTFSLSLAGLRNIMQIIRITELIRFFKLGFRMKKAVFIYDVIRYLFSPGNWKSFLLLKLHLRSDLQQKTIFRYLLEKTE